MKPRNESFKNWDNRHKYCSKKCIHLGKPSWNKGLKTGLIPKTAYKKGEHPSPKTQFKKGLVPWNKNKKGIMPTPWNKGKRFKQIMGENHHNWKGGISKLSNLIRRLPEMKSWRRKIFKRDNHSCQNCKSKCKKELKVILEAHHIKSFSLILKENNIKTTEQALSCLELWDIKNGITLCNFCHLKTRKK